MNKHDTNIETITKISANRETEFKHNQRSDFLSMQRQGLLSEAYELTQSDSFDTDKVIGILDEAEKISKILSTLYTNGHLNSGCKSYPINGVAY